MPPTSSDRLNSPSPISLTLVCAAALTRLSKTLRSMSSFQVIVAGFAIVTLSGTLLLTLPQSTRDGQGQGFTDALFMATSAISTTGLVVADPGSYYTVFGQITIIAIVQIGGLGYMVFIVMAGYLLHRSPSLTLRKLMRDSLAGTQLADMKRFVKLTLVYTFTAEAAGGLILACFWFEDCSALHALYLGLYHSISAFCTAGFSLFPDSLMSMRDNIPFNLIIDLICLIGGIGFFVLYDIHSVIRKRIGKIFPHRFSLHTKLVLYTTLILTGLSTILLVFNKQEFTTVPGFSSRLLSSSFQVISASTTTGYNSIDIGSMQPSSLFLIAILMFIGASPGSTGGGIKTSTLAVMFLYMSAILHGRNKVGTFRRQLSSETVNTAFAASSLAIVVISVSLFILCQTQTMDFSKLFFETVSAFGNAGLSTGITSALTSGGKYIIILLMFIGRIGVLTVGYSLMANTHANEMNYPVDEVYIG